MTYTSSQIPTAPSYERLKISSSKIETEIFSVEENGTYITLQPGQYLISTSALIINYSGNKDTYYMALDVGDGAGERVSGSQQVLQTSESRTFNVLGQLIITNPTKVGIEINNSPTVSVLITYIIKIR